MMTIWFVSAGSVSYNIGIVCIFLLSSYSSLSSSLLSFSPNLLFPEFLHISWAQSPPRLFVNYWTSITFQSPCFKASWQYWGAAHRVRPTVVWEPCFRDAALWRFKPGLTTYEWWDIEQIASFLLLLSCFHLSNEKNKTIYSLYFGTTQWVDFM